MTGASVAGASTAGASLAGGSTSGRPRALLSDFVEPVESHRIEKGGRSLLYLEMEAMVQRQNEDGRPLDKCEKGRVNKAGLIVRDAKLALVIAPSCQDGGVSVNQPKGKQQARVLPTFDRVRGKPKAKANPAAQATARNTIAATVVKSLPLQRNALLTMLRLSLIHI